jgi:MMPL family
VFSGFQVLGQIGTTIGLGLLFDTLIVRSFMTPSVANASRALVLAAATGAPVHRPARCCGPTGRGRRFANCSYGKTTIQP